MKLAAKVSHRRLTPGVVARIGRPIPRGLHRLGRFGDAVSRAVATHANFGKRHGLGCRRSQSISLELAHEPIAATSGGAPAPRPNRPICERPIFSRPAGDLRFSKIKSACLTSTPDAEAAHSGDSN